MSKITQLLNYLETFSPEKKGKVFELYCKWFLENDPRYTAQIKKVWLWKDWPENWGIEKGIDLIAETHSGQLWAIQAKAYDQDYYITKADLDSFLSESARAQFSFRLFIATTNKLGPNARETISGQEKEVSLCLLDKLEEATLEWPTTVEDLKVIVKKELKNPWPHQQAAIDNILNGFKNSNRGQLYMACGTGKTLVGLWVAQNMKSQNTLVLVPSISLVAQLYAEWAQNRDSNFDFDPIFICSDPTVHKKEDEIDQLIAQTELGFPITTDAQELLNEVKLNHRPKVIFSTYHSSPVLVEACKLDSSLIFDLAIADEAHRCAGPLKSDFTLIVDKEAIRVTSRLFMTATPKIFSDNVKQKTKEVDYEIASMDEEAKFGPVFHKLSFSEAIKNDLLTDYQVIISIMDHSTYREYADKGRFVSINDHETDARTLASQLLVAKAMKEYGLSRVISFHNRKSTAKEFIKTFDQAIELLPESERPKITLKETIFGEMLQSERKKILNKLKDAEINSAGLIANVKCLSEGVDVPTLDGIAFIDPKGSEIDIVQAVGRAIRKTSDKKMGMIMIPVFLDKEADEEIDLNQSCFKQVWKVIKALRAHDDILAEELDNIRLELGKQTYRKPAKLTKILFDVSIGITSEFAEAISLKIVDTCSAIYLSSYLELMREWHPIKNGSLDPSKIIAGSAQSIWWRCSKDSRHEWSTKCYSRTSSIKSGCPFCAGKKVDASNSLGSLYPALKDFWHYSKNENLKPESVTVKSGKKVWWVCRMGPDHEWESAVAHITDLIQKNPDSNFCPICNGTKIVYSNSLAAINPNLAKQWHPKKNEQLTAETVSPGSHTIVWWLCDVATDHEWPASIQQRSRAGNRCPMCRGSMVVLSNSLAYKYPDLANEWHPYKNNSLTPEQIHSGSKKKVFWACIKSYDHDWKATVDNRVRGSGCPFCKGQKVALSNCLKTTHPELVAEWNHDKNGLLKPEQVKAGSGKVIWWKCLRDEKHTWPAKVTERVRGYKCPICSNKQIIYTNSLLCINPDLAKQWHLDKNKLTPLVVGAGSTKKVWWLCSQGHEWEAAISDRHKKKSGCPHCYRNGLNQSKI